MRIASAAIILGFTAYAVAYNSPPPASEGSSSGGPYSGSSSSGGSTSGGPYSGGYSSGGSSSGSSSSGSASSGSGYSVANNPPSKADLKKIMALLNSTSIFRQLIEPCSTFNAAWIRTVFHDCAGGSTLDNTGGLDGSLQFELSRTENAGLAPTIGFFQSFVEPGVSLADVIALGGVASVAFCGGPVIPYHPGRVDATTANPTGRVPSATSNLQFLYGVAGRLGLVASEQVALFQGVHTYGGAHSANSPGVTSQTFQSFDGTPTTYDLNVFKVIQEGQSILGTDQVSYADPILKGYVDTYAYDKNTFTTNFMSAFKKCINLNQIPNLDPLILVPPTSTSAAFYRTEDEAVVEVSRRGYEAPGTQPEHDTPCDPSSTQSSRCSLEHGYVETCSEKTRTWTKYKDTVLEALPAGWECRDSHKGHHLVPPVAPAKPYAKYRRSTDEAESLSDGEASSEVPAARKKRSVDEF
ncbi:heme peroxidase [Blyttiomyces helicus]|uniref:Peroxidase n=1 Tax=Blyttiomyces helicus TaxID=388810 RepID=A0A4V1IS95_9FUNG|nr:heme peroxidase [Blyttiomyces helicus]|eukprot:RKO92777.1 heme peroxidase [Blyttiomyces helicus]